LAWLVALPLALLSRHKPVRQLPLPELLNLKQNLGSPHKRILIHLRFIE